MVCAALLAALTMTGCAPAAKLPNADTIIAGANALDKAFVDAFNRGDAEAMAALYWNSPEVVSYMPDMLQARGVPAIKEANAKAFAAMLGAKLELTESHQMAAGDVAIGWGLYRLTAPGIPEILGRYTDVKAERDGKWVYLMDHGSVPVK